MFLFAVTAAEKLQKIPTAFWINVGIAVLIIVGVVIVLRKLAGTNKVVLAVVSALIISVVGFNWVYERNEPKFLTPFVDKLAGFFPTKAGYNAKQQTAPKS
ncbi:MAG: hypothetical protein H7343_13720 [Undibacterium sp.]|nr:hypothetical protein [Opitutaceae bacterium]